jgi:hypothetical protein
MFLVGNEMCGKCKMNTEISKLSIKKVKQTGVLVTPVIPALRRGNRRLFCSKPT